MQHVFFMLSFLLLQHTASSVQGAISCFVDGLAAFHGMAFLFSLCEICVHGSDEFRIAGGLA